MNLKTNQSTIVVTAQQMLEIEHKLFANQMPVASLMEKVALLASQKFMGVYPPQDYPQVGITIGCGHNGGDGLVMARELFLDGYNVSVYEPLAQKAKDLTQFHSNYARFLGINFVDNIEDLRSTDVIIDALFGFGLTRSIAGQLKEDIDTLNQWQKPVVSIDLPSGIHTDTGNVLGIGVKARHTFCLGLWKRGLWQKSALEYIGNPHLIDIGIPEKVITESIDLKNSVQLMSIDRVKEILPLPRSLNTHKYQQGNALIIAGSQQYAGASLLSAYGANSAGIGMLTMVVPSAIKLLINSNLPSALAVEAPQTESGEFSALPIADLNLSRYDTIAWGMGIGRNLNETVRQSFQELLTADNILLIDADGLNLLVQENWLPLLKQRSNASILTPHEGEFARLFPEINLTENPSEAIKQASLESNSIILLKGAKTLICDRGGKVWIIPEGTPALARGGSGDVLSGLLTALVSQGDYENYSIADMVAVGAWLHQQAGILATKDVSEMGVDGVVLAEYIKKTICNINKNLPLFTQI